MDAASVEGRGGIKDFGMGPKGRESMIFGVMEWRSKVGRLFILHFLMAVFGTVAPPWQKTAFCPAEKVLEKAGTRKNQNSLFNY
jgi:hypothetical protein